MSTARISTVLKASLAPVVLFAWLAMGASAYSQPSGPSPEEKFWSDSFQRLWHPPEELPEQEIKLGAKLVQSRAAKEPALYEVVRTRLRNSQDPLERIFAARTIVKVQGTNFSADCLYMLSDPVEEISSWGSGMISVNEMQELTVSLPALLLHEKPYYRSVTLRQIQRFFREKGLPYFVALLYDKDLDVAAQAARGFAVCRREDAVPHLLRFLKQNGGKRRCRAVVSEAVVSLQRLFDESPALPKDPAAAAKAWVARLEAGVQPSGKAE